MDEIKDKDLKLKKVKQLAKSLLNNWGAIIGVSNAVLGDLRTGKKRRNYSGHLSDTDNDFLNATFYILCRNNLQIIKEDNTPENFINIKDPSSPADFAVLEEIFSVQPSPDILQHCINFLEGAKQDGDLFMNYDESIISHFNKNDEVSFGLWKKIIHFFVSEIAGV
jgi:hypothetical protein